MRIIECLHTDSRCYKAAEPSYPVGIVVHSTGVNNPSLKRYVQPSKDDPKYDELIAMIGKNIAHQIHAGHLGRTATYQDSEQFCRAYGFGSLIHEPLSRPLVI